MNHGYFVPFLSPKRLRNDFQEARIGKGSADKSARTDRVEKCKKENRVSLNINGHLPSVKIIDQMFDPSAIIHLESEWPFKWVTRMSNIFIPICSSLFKVSMHGCHSLSWEEHEKMVQNLETKKVRMFILNSIQNLCTGNIPFIFHGTRHTVLFEQLENLQNAIS